MSKKKITMEEVMELVKTGKYDEYGHLLITNKTYKSYCEWFMGTLNDHSKKSMMYMKKINPSKFKSIICNMIATSYYRMSNDYILLVRGKKNLPPYTLISLIHQMCNPLDYTNR